MQGRWLVDAAIAERMNIGKPSLIRAINSSCSFTNSCYHFPTGETLFNNKVRLSDQQVRFYYLKKYPEQDPMIYDGNHPQWMMIYNEFSSKKSVRTQAVTRKRKSPDNSNSTTSSSTTSVNNSNSNTTSTTNSKRPKLHIPVSIFVLKMEQLKLAWSNMYKDNLSEPFPSQYIAFLDRGSDSTNKQMLRPAQHENPQSNATGNSDSQGVYSIKMHGVYNKRTETIISKIQLTKRGRANDFVEALRRGMTYKKCQLRTPHSQLQIAAFSVTHPQVTPDSIQLCIAIAR